MESAPTHIACQTRDKRTANVLLIPWLLVLLPTEANRLNPENTDAGNVDGPASPDGGGGGLVSLPPNVCITAIAVARCTARRRDALEPESERRSCGALSGPPPTISTSTSSDVVVTTRAG